MIIKGIDVSYYDGLLDWKQYDLDFAFIKASEGTVIDNAFKQQWANARGYTLRSAYHFFRPFIDPINSASAFFDYLNGDYGELPPALDLEVADGQKEPIAIALKWLDRFEMLTNIQPMIYSSPNFLRVYKAINYPRLKEYRLWLASYPWDEINVSWTEEQREKRITDIWEDRWISSPPTPPAPFSRVSFWQFTGKGNPSLINGYTSSKAAVDLNIYNGQTIDDLYQEFDIAGIIRPPQGDNMTVLYKMDLKSGLTANVRDVANGNIITGTISGLVTVDIDSEAIHAGNFDWYHISAPKVGWVAKTTQFENFRAAGTPPPTPQPVVTHTILVFSDGSIKVD